jgi:hypothetical protein
MLEDLAIQYVNQSEENLRLIGYGFVLLGGVISGVVSRSTMVLLRAPYFVFSGILLLSTAAIQFIWLGSLSAMAGGYVWVFFSVEVISSITIGYFYGIIAMARSRDAYGHARNAALAFIPFANILLLSKPTKNELLATPTIAALTGGVGVLIGSVMLAAGIGMSQYLTIMMQRQVEDAQRDPAAQAVGIAYLLKSQGLEGTLKQLALEVPTRRVDETTTLKRAEGDGRTLRYIYEVSVDVAVLPTSMRKVLVQKDCTYKALRPIFEAGATFEYVYSRRDGSKIGTVTVTREICGF